MLMSRTPDRLGVAVAGHAVGFQVSAATLGTAVLPGGHGLLADIAGVKTIPVGIVLLAAIVAALVRLLERGSRTAPDRQRGT